MQTKNRTTNLKERIKNIDKNLNWNKEYINRLNVFPVPDGDTGLNMSLTVQGAIASMPDFDNDSLLAGDYLKSFAEQLLMNSRGCSGVILSLYGQGVSQVIGNTDFSKENIVKALENGYENAYKGTENPQEGTILTLMREFKEEYGRVMNDKDDPAVTIKKCIPHLKKVLKKTPDMLPVLKKAGVVDSGGAGFLIILDGIDKKIKKGNGIANSLSVSNILNINRATKRSLKNKSSNPKDGPFAALLPYFGINMLPNFRLNDIIEDYKNFLKNLLVNGNFRKKKDAIISELDDMEHSWNPEINYQYCTEFILESTKISSKEQIKELIENYGDSTIILNSRDKYKVHIHTNKPETIFNEVSKFGELIFTKVDDMKKQHRNLISNDTIAYEREKCVFCIVSARGFTEILKDLGADDIFCYGKNKPSVKRLVKELDGLKTKNIITAADDKDILMALKYAVSLSKSNVHIVESSNVISLISMMMGISKELDITLMFESITSSLNDIRFCGIAKAIRSTAQDGREVNKNDFFAVSNGKIISSHQNIEILIINVITELIGDESLVSLYTGVPAKKQNSIIPNLKISFPDVEFEEYYGGQYQYHYYITFE